MSIKPGPAPTDPNQLLGAAAKFSQRTLVRKTGDIRDEITANADGTRSESWYAGGVEATYAAGQKDPTIVVQGANVRADGIMNDYSKSDFPGFEWIKRSNYTGVQTIVGIPCIVFHDGPAQLGSANAPLSPGAPVPIPQTGSTAFIAADSRLPVLLQTDDGTILYQWEQPPTSPLTIPPGMQDFINTMQVRKQAAAAPPAAP